MAFGSAATPLNPVTGSQKLEATYGYQGRRVEKKVYIYNAGTWILDTTKTFVYDGWNVIREQTASCPPPPATCRLRTDDFVWGLDLSGSLQGAGGIGGLLLWKNDRGHFLYVYDANGNVGQLVNAATGAIAARYEYDPYGNVLVADGPEAQNNQFRFSTKYFDAETGLYYYGYRYYSTKLGRWTTRDPIEEQGGVNLYGFVGNDPINRIDPFGTRQYSFPNMPYNGGIQAGDQIQVGCDHGNYRALIGTITIEAYYPVDKLRFPDKATGGWSWHAGGGVRLSALFEEEEACCCPDKWCWKKLFDRNGTCCCPQEACCCPDKSYRWIQAVTRDATPGQPPSLFGYYDTPNLPGTPDFPYYYSQDMLDNGSWYFERIDETIELYKKEGNLVRFRFIDVPFNGAEVLQYTPQTTVKFSTRLVCASQANRTLAYFNWGFVYDAAGVRLF